MAKTPDAPIARSRRVPPLREPNAWAQRLEQLRAAGAPLLDLTDMNPTRLGLVDHTAVADTLTRVAKDPRVARYEPDPRGLLSARRAVADYYGGAVEPERILLTTGTSESYAHLFRLLADPGEAVLIPTPSYPLFDPIAAAEGVTVAPYRLQYENGAWIPEARSIEQACMQHDPRALIAVQPNIPTGSALSPSAIQTCDEVAVARGMALISDEVFADFPWPPASDRIPSLLGERAAPTFVLGGLSKSCGLPQLKLGWIAACGPDEPTRELLAGLEWMADLFLSVATPVQLALPELLQTRHAFQTRVAERLATNLATLRERTRGSDAALLEAQGGWAAIVTLPESRTGEDWALALLDREVVAHPDHFYDLERSSVVVSLIVEPDVLHSGIERLVALVKES